MLFKIHGKVLQEAREDLGYSRETLGRLARVGGKTIHAIERDSDYGPSWDRTVESLAFPLGLRPEQLAPDYIPPVPPLESVRYDPEAVKSIKSEKNSTVEQIAPRSAAVKT